MNVLPPWNMKFEYSVWAEQWPGDYGGPEEHTEGDDWASTNDIDKWVLEVNESMRRQTSDPGSFEEAAIYAQMGMVLALIYPFRKQGFNKIWAAQSGDWGTSITLWNTEKKIVVNINVAGQENRYEEWILPFLYGLEDTAGRPTYE